MSSTIHVVDICSTIHVGDIYSSHLQVHVNDLHVHVQNVPSVTVPFIENWAFPTKLVLVELKEAMLEIKTFLHMSSSKSARPSLIKDYGVDLVRCT